MMRIRFGALLICSIVLLSNSALFSQNNPPSEKSPAKMVLPEKATFDQIFHQWKSILNQLEILQKEYQIADTERREEIKKQFRNLAEKGEKMQPEVLSAAEKAYSASPNTDTELTNLLLATAYQNCRLDNYEEALRLSNLLIQNNCPDNRIYNIGGVAAFATSHFEKAEQYLKAVAEANKPIGIGDPGLDSVVHSFMANPAKFKRDLAKEQELRAEEAKADDLPRVLLKTDKGDIEIELFENEAPNTVANFISLIERGFYDGLTFHRVLPGFMAQGGCPTGNGTGGPGYHIPCECNKSDARKHFRGSISMAHAGPNTGGSQFFLTFIPTVSLDGRHTAFGRITKGMEVLSKIQRRNPQMANQPKPDKIVKAEVIRKRDHEYKPKKTGQ